MSPSSSSKPKAQDKKASKPPPIARRLETLVEEYHLLYGPEGYVSPGHSSKTTTVSAPSPKERSSKKQPDQDHHDALCLCKSCLQGTTTKISATTTISGTAIPVVIIPKSALAKKDSKSTSSKNLAAPTPQPAPSAHISEVGSAHSAPHSNKDPPAKPPSSKAASHHSGSSSHHLPKSPSSKTPSTRSVALSAKSSIPEKSKPSVPQPSPAGSARALSNKSSSHHSKSSKSSSRGHTKEPSVASSAQSTAVQEEKAEHKIPAEDQSSGVEAKKVNFDVPPTASSTRDTVLSGATATTYRTPVRLVIFFDGAWQSRRDVQAANIAGTPTSNEGAFFTNVALLSQCLKPSAKGDDYGGERVPQVSLYIPGAGAKSVQNSRGTRGAGSNSVNQNVESAWSWLSDNWQPNDELFIFGFSRGAFAARALAGLIHWGGILSKAQAAFIKPICEAYFQRHPEKPKSSLHAANTLRAVTGCWPNPQAPGMYDVAATMTPGSGLDPNGRRRKTQTDSCHQVEVSHLLPAIAPPWIKVLGVWDTVTDSNCPGPCASLNGKEHYSYFDPGLGHNVEHAFHALALDEERKDFLPTLFYQYADAPPFQVLHQTWFPGSHADVGGGYREHGLSDIALAWMVAHLRDRKHGPLLNLDVSRLSKLQDERMAWAHQPPHASRTSLEARAIRQVGVKDSSIPPSGKTPWSDDLFLGRTYESLHHSVVVSQRHFPRDSEQFDWLRRTQPGRLIELWHEATQPNSLLFTETYLRWDRGVMLAPPEQNFKMVSSQYEPESAPKRHRTLSLTRSKSRNDHVPHQYPPTAAPNMGYYYPASMPEPPPQENSHQRHQSEPGVPYGTPAGPAPAAVPTQFNQTAKQPTLMRSVTNWFRGDKSGPSAPPPVRSGRRQTGPPSAWRYGPPAGQDTQAQANPSHPLPPPPAPTGVPAPVDDFYPQNKANAVPSIASAGHSSHHSLATVKPASSMSVDSFDRWHSEYPASAPAAATGGREGPVLFAPQQTAPKEPGRWTFSVPKPSWSTRRRN